MNYKAHIPAGIAFAAAATFITGSPLVLSAIIGGAIGGALSDMDQEGSAIEKIGTKTAEAAHSMAGKTKSKSLKTATTVGKFFGKITDTIIFHPIAKVWKWLAKNVLAKAYYAVYHKINAKERFNWSAEDPAKHRGGLTHSFSFLLTMTILMSPFFLLFGFWFWAGMMLGILSHLFADSLCRSGVKFFWPWFPIIGFKDKNGQRKGHDIRLMPARFQVSTGAVNSKKELEQYSGDELKEKKRLWRLEKAWQRIFQILAILFIVLTVTGVGPGSGVISIGDMSINVTKANVSVSSVPSDAKEDQTKNVALSEQQAIVEEDAQSSSNGQSVTVPETEGPVSLTYGDLDISKIPKGIMKMPDESLWVVGVGPVSRETLESPTLSLTQAEKDSLLAVSAAQRVAGLPDAAGEAIKETAEGTGNFITDLLNNITGGSLGGGGGSWGFVGLTPYTNTSKE